MIMMSFPRALPAPRPHHRGSVCVLPDRRSGPVAWFRHRQRWGGQPRGRRSRQRPPLCQPARIAGRWRRGEFLALVQTLPAGACRPVIG
jgi:hypothetical protein